MRRERLQKITLSGLILAVALIIGIIEHSLPPIIPMLPFIKLGLGNAVITLAYLFMGSPVAILLMIMRVGILAVFSGNPIMLAFSFTAGVGSLALSIGLLKTGKFSLVAVSSLSAVAHNLLQIVVAYIVMGTAVVFTYIPYMILLGSIAGALTGICNTLIIRYLPQNIINKFQKTQ